ncbi:MAG: IS1380 family transposase [Campylobacter sp.]|nr:IS1380 family transposase [Campylobacter sp.]
MKNFKIERCNKFLSLFAGISIIAVQLVKLTWIANKYLKEEGKTKRWITAWQIVSALLIMFCFGKSNYEDITIFNRDNLFIRIIGRLISPEALRQHFKKIAQNDDFYKFIDACNIKLIKKKKLQKVYVNGKYYYPIDIDVTPLIDTESHKEGISCTYKLKNGFAPIVAYLAQYALAFDLREGKQHSADGAVEFLQRVVEMAKSIGIDPADILVRVDSGHDDSEFIKMAEHLKVKYIVKRNFRRTPTDEFVAFAKKNSAPKISKDGCTAVYRYVDLKQKPKKAPDSDAISVFEVRDPIKYEKLGRDEFAKVRVTDKNDPRFGKDGVEYEVHAWYTNLHPAKPLTGKNGKSREEAFAKEISNLYKNHATSEQYHSEVKTDMNMELLPSHAFATNKAFFALVAVAFNINRNIGDSAVACDTSFQHHKWHKTERIRIGTVIKTLLKIPCVVRLHAREVKLNFSKNEVYFNTFKMLCKQIS